MSFADEAKAASRGETVDIAKIAASLGVTDTATEPASPLPTGQAPVVELDITKAVMSAPEPTKAVAPVEPKAEVKETPVEPPKPSTKIRIGGIEFDSAEEAIKYADDLALARQQEEAYRDGYQKAKTEAEPKKVEKSVDELIEEKLFENPKEAFKELRQKVKEEIFDEYNKLTAKQNQEAQQKAAAEKIWSSFYSEHTDLSSPDTRDYIQNYLLPKHWDALKDLPQAQSLPKLAQMARSALRITKEQALPAVELSSAPAVVPGASNSASSVTPGVTESEPVDFVTQVNQARRRKAK